MKVDNDVRVPLRLVRRAETEALAKMKVGESLVTDRNGQSAMAQWGRRHGMGIVVRRISKAKWRVWRTA